MKKKKKSDPTTVGVGWQRHRKACRSLRELDNQRTCCFVFFWRSPQLAVELDHFVRGGEPLLRAREMIGSRSVYGKAPMPQLHSNPIAASGSGHAGKRINTFEALIHMQESPPHKRLLVGFSSTFMRVA